MTNQIAIYDHLIGEQIVRDMTADEIAERDAEIAAYLKAKAEAAEEAKIKKEEAEAKLNALGLTIDDLKAAGLG